MDVSNDNKFWCSYCETLKHGIEHLFDPGIGPEWPVITWCPICGRIQYGDVIETPEMGKRTPLVDEYMAVLERSKEEMDYYEREGRKIIDG